MLKIDNLILHLPPEFAGQERTFGMAVARALADIPVTGNKSIKSLSQTVSSPLLLSGNDAFAREIAANIHRGLGAISSNPGHTGRSKWPK